MASIHRTRQAASKTMSPDPSAWLKPHDGPSKILFLAPGEPLRTLHVTNAVGTTPADVEVVPDLIPDLIPDLMAGNARHRWCLRSRP